MILFSETLPMALMRVRRAAQLTLPAELRKALKVKEGDYLEAHIVAGGVLLAPVAVVKRKRAFAAIEAAVAQVRDREPNAAETVLAAEKKIAREVTAARRRHA